jgi:hypothetical protein
MSVRGYLGRRCFITEVINPIPIEITGGRWGQKVKLECGHIGLVISRSRNHRRTRPIKHAFCTECPPREKKTYASNRASTDLPNQGL